MAKIPNKFVLFGAVAIAALAVPGLLGPMAAQHAYAEHQTAAHQSNEATQTAEKNLVNVQAAVQANADVDVNDVTVCVLAEC